MIKYIAFLFSSIFSISFVHAQTNEFFYQTQSGSHELEFQVDHSFSETNQDTSGTKSKASQNLTSLGVQYAMGINEMLAFDVRLGFATGEEETKYAGSPSSNEKTEVSGMEDIKASLLGHHEMGPGSLHWEADLSYSLGALKSEDTNATDSEDSANSGRTTITAMLGYAYQQESCIFGGSIEVSLYQSDADVESTDTTGSKTDFTGEGAEHMMISFFYERPSEIILWGLSLNYRTTGEIDLKVNGTSLGTFPDEKVIGLNWYFKLPSLGPGDLIGNLAYESYQSSGGAPAAEIDDGTGFELGIGYRLTL